MNRFNLSAIAASAGILTLVKSVKSLISGVSQSIQVYSHFESLQKGLETFFQSADKGKEKFDELRKFSNETTFGVDELANAFTQLANVGTDVDTITEKLTMIGNISGGDKQKFADLVSIYSKILSTGKAGSMQLQQLALRGVPIYDMLKKIGVTGSATGEQITQVFKEMTEAGGQFYNAMNNINETIEGKEGFVSDYWREMLNNFADASGLAETYKSVLDIIKEVMGNITDALFSISNNAVAKALFQGTLVTLITGVGVAITAILIPAITKLIAKLITVNILKGPVGWATLAVAGIAGVTTAVVGLANAWGEASNAVDNYDKSAGKGGGGYDGAPVKTTATDYFKEYEKKIIEYNTQIEEQKKIIKEMVKSSKGKKLNNSVSGIKEAFEVSEKIDKAKETLKQLYEMKESAENVKKAYESSMRAESLFTQANQYKETFKEIQKAYSPESDSVEKIKSLMQDVEKLKLIKSHTLIKDTDLVNEINNTISVIESQIKPLEIKVAIAKQNDWQKTMSDILGFSGSDVKSLIDSGYTGTSGVGKYLDNIYNANTKETQINKLFGFKTTPQAMAINNYNKILSDSKKLLSNENFSTSDKTAQAFKVALKNVEDELNKFGLKVNDVGEIVENSLSEWTNEQLKNGNFGGTLVGTVASQSSDVSNFMDGFAQGGIWGGIIQTIVMALYKACSGVENFEEAINPVTTIIENLSTLLTSVFELCVAAVTILKAISKIIDTIIKVLRPLLKLINTIVQAIGDVLTYIANGFEWVIDKLFGWVEDFLGTTEEEEDTTEDLTEAYESLLKALKENEEYYLSRKKELNASDYIDKVTGVHDMILTPQGNFSTDPDDYIIASKHPEQLNGSGMIMCQPIIQNYASNDTDVKVSQTSSNGISQLVVQISKKVASDYLSGSNGWDSAISARTLAQQGRGVVG